MAVTSPVIPNLSGSYANIQDALRQGAQIAGQNYGTMGAVASAAAPIGEEVQKERQLSMQASLQDLLEQNKYKYAANAEGKTLINQDNIDSYFKNQGLDPKYAPQIGSKGVYLGPGDQQTILANAQKKAGVDTFANFLIAKDPINGPAKAAITRAYPEDKDIANYFIGGGKAHIQDIGGYHYPMNAFGQVLNQIPLEFTTNPVSNSTNYITDMSQLSKDSRKTIKDTVDKYNHAAEPIKQAQESIDKANALLSDPKAKAVGQNLAIMSEARGAAGSMRNWKDFEIVEGLPDAVNTLGRMYDKRIKGQSLTDEDMKAFQAATAVIKQSEQDELQRVTDTYVNQGSGMTHFHPESLRKLLTGGDIGEVKKIKVKRLFDGSVGWLDPKDFDSSKYQKL